MSRCPDDNLLQPPAERIAARAAVQPEGGERVKYCSHLSAVCAGWPVSATPMIGQICGPAKRPLGSALQSTGSDLDRATDNAEIKQVMKLDYEECGLSKGQLADVLHVPANTITDWLAPSKPQFCMPMKNVSAWVAATGSDRLIRLLLPAHFRRLVEIGELTVQAVTARRKRGELLEEVA